MGLIDVDRLEKHLSARCSDLEVHRECFPGSVSRRFCLALSRLATKRLWPARFEGMTPRQKCPRDGGFFYLA